MSILSRLHQIIDRDAAKLFGAAKRASVIAHNDVEKAKAQLEAAQQRAIEAAEQTLAHARNAAECARVAAQELEIEAKAAAEKIAFHRSQLPEKTDPTL